ncbi:hypothetical protein, partial [Pseudomonas syringae group genomosp. 7]|uniref:hypothetical protein n=1 Tax=Pseudomonas syringae group genomosp. 7 TaxID=251699 RepID=UPI0037706BD2
MLMRGSSSGGSFGLVLFWFVWCGVCLFLCGVFFGLDCGWGLVLFVLWGGGWCWCCCCCGWWVVCCGCCVVGGVCFFFGGLFCLLWF